jgi:glycosyltransferase involved in cell wall biosynthesis
VGSPSPRTVLYLHSSARLYGSDRQLLAIAGGLDPRRYRPLVVLAEHGPLADELARAGVEVQVRPLAVLRRALMSPRGVARIAASFASDAAGLGRLARSRGVALVHTNTSVTLGGAAAARVAGVPHVWHVREIYAAFDRWFSAYRRLLLTADALPCVSRATREQFPAAAAAFTLHDGLPYPPDRAPRAEARRELGLDPGAFVVAVLGRIAAWKGQDVLVRAIAQLPADAVALVCGEPWPGEESRQRELEQLAASLGVGDRVRLTGVLGRPGLAFGAADVVAVPSTLPDPFPNSALEAAAAGCCVVGADHGGIPEIVEHDRTGLLVAPGSPDDLAAALGELRGDHPRIMRLGSAAEQLVAERFSRERMLGEVQTLYDRLTGTAPARSSSPVTSAAAGRPNQ